MNKLFYIALIMIATEDLAGQNLTMEDMVKNIRQYKESKTIRSFVEKHGFNYDTTINTGKTVRMYGFLGEKEYSVKGLDDDTLAMNNAVFVKMDDEVTLRKVTLLTAAKEYYEQLVGEMIKKKFTVVGSQDRSRPMTYQSELYKGISVTLSVVEAVKNEKRYARYQIVVSY